MSWRARLALAFGTLGAYLVFLVATLPAAVVVARWVPPELGIDPGAVQGSVWNGSLETLLVGEARLGPVRWSGCPWRLFLGEAAYDLDIQGEDLKAAGRLGWGLVGGTLAVRDLGLSFDVGVLRQLGVVPVRLQGTAEGRVGRLDWRPGELPLVQGELDWKAAALELPARLDLGEMKLRASADDDGSKIIWEGQPGSVDVDGSLTLSLPVDYRIQMTVKPVGDLDPSARGVLGMLGRPGADGSYRLNVAGRITQSAPAGD